MLPTFTGIEPRTRSWQSSMISLDQLVNLCGGSNMTAVGHVIFSLEKIAHLGNCMWIVTDQFL